MPEVKLIPPVEVKIEYTYDYDKFIYIPINRDRDKAHVANLALAIQNRNLLHLFPIIVNLLWEVMDGQHRISAVHHIMVAKMFKLPIYYIQDNSVTADDISLLNTNKINWKNADYIKYFAGKGNEAFLELIKFNKKHSSIALSTVLSIASSKKRSIAKLKKGDITLDRLEAAEQCLTYVYDLRKRMNSLIWKSRDFIEAVQAISDTGQYDHKRLMQSSRNVPQNWDKQISKHSYVFEIQQMYNTGQPESACVNFLKLIKDQQSEQQ